MWMVWVNPDQARAIGRLLSRLRGGLEVDTFTDPRYYPPPGEAKRSVAMYFLVMVAMDHRLSRPGAPYEGVVDGELYHGADLLYRLGMKRYTEDPGFFTAERLSRVSEREVLEWLSIEYRGRRITPPDPGVRAGLLRDLGLKLMVLYDGDPFRIIVESRGMLRRGVGDGFIDRLKVFKAYQDPVEKKAFLLAKFLERRNVLEVADHWNKEVPVDNHLARIAVRTGIIGLSRQLIERIARQKPLTAWEDTMIRMAARQGYRIVSQASGIDPFTLDDFLWLFGRRCCTREEPVCRTGCRRVCSAIEGCNGGCILAPACRAYRNPLLMLPEHSFLETWWY
ncbi:MAG: hypothetical protein GSR86_04420 [Desulfurococcales archaeon]|nr:hypothetical protein [Desulfurococcales archaeon]